MSILTNLAGRIGTAWQDLSVIADESGTYFAVARLDAKTGDKTYSPMPLPTAFRTQLDVRSTAAALNARVIGGRVSAAVIGSHHSTAWKSDRDANNVASLEALVNNPHPTLTITKAQYKAIVEYYAES